MSPARLLCPGDVPGKNTGSGWPFPSPGDLPDPGIESGSPALQAGSLLSEPPGTIHKQTCTKVKLFPSVSAFKSIVYKIFWWFWLKLGSLRSRSWDEDLSTSHLFWREIPGSIFQGVGHGGREGKEAGGRWVTEEVTLQAPGALSPGASSKLCGTWLRVGAPEGKDAGEIVV